VGALIYTSAVKFFVPAANDAAHAEELYGAIYRFNREQMQAELSPRRIHSVRGVHDGKPFVATVGEPFEVPPEVVVAILLDTTRNCYLICTANRGVARGMPYLSGTNEIRSVDYFDE
jgi:hypothetical protein